MIGGRYHLINQTTKRTRTFKRARLRRKKRWCMQVCKIKLYGLNANFLILNLSLITCLGPLHFLDNCPKFKVYAQILFLEKLFSPLGESRQWSTHLIKNCHIFEFNDSITHGHNLSRQGFFFFFWRIEHMKLCKYFYSCF